MARPARKAARGQLCALVVLVCPPVFLMCSLPRRAYPISPGGIFRFVRVVDPVTARPPVIRMPVFEFQAAGHGARSAWNAVGRHPPVKEAYLRAGFAARVAPVEGHPPARV
eukprot:8726955-Lingulodinium_polyedra.AAC.1